MKKQHKPGSAKKKKQVSAKTRVKLSQAAKKRRRGPKGSIYGGRFLDGLAQAGGIHLSKAGGKRSAFRGSGSEGARHDADMAARGRRSPFGVSEAEFRGDVLATKSRIEGDLSGAGVHDPLKRESMARSFTRNEVTARTGHSPDLTDMEAAPMSIRNMDIREVNRQAREGKWKSQRGVYGNADIGGSAQGTRKLGEVRGPSERGYISSGKFIDTELAPSHREWVMEALADPKSPFNAGFNPTRPEGRKHRTVSAGAQNRLNIYTRALQSGASHDEAVQMLGQRPGPRAPTDHVAGGLTQGDIAAVAGRGRPSERKTKAPGRKSKYESTKPKPGEFQFGIEAPSPHTIEQWEKIKPGLNDKDYVKIQQAEKQHIFADLEKNQTWAHETKRANLLGERNGTVSESPDRITFFTTNMGGPAPSVPADSLVGQYIIKRRKRMLQEDNLYSSAQLRGKFPQAVRDQHIIEISSGISIGAEGKAGLWHRGGYRAGGKKSPNFGKSVPFGAQVLYDSQGRPSYDSEGNMRYTDGGTRPFAVGTDKEVGLRIFIG